MIETNALNAIASQVSWIGPVTAATIAVFKPLLPEKYIPLIALIVGIGFGLAAIDVSITGGIVGLICGLSATGLYELVKKPGV